MNRLVSHQLQEPADRGVRIVALSLLDDAMHASATLRHAAPKHREWSAEADDALHDFRVAVRRLRSWLRTSRPTLRGAISRRQRSDLGEIFDETGTARDAAVHLEWMRRQHRTLKTRERMGHAWLKKRLQAEHERGRRAALSAARSFDAITPKLFRRLRSYRSFVRPQEPPPRLGTVIGERILRESEALQSSLAAINDAADVDSAHRARIAAKRLRYVAEHASALVSGGDDIIAELVRLQDTLGDLHDVHVFSATIAVPHERARRRSGRQGELELGLTALTRRLRARGARAYGRIEHEWLSQRAAPFFERVRDVAAEVARLGRLGTEIERKYLVTRLPDQALGAPSVEIRQGYLPGAHLVERVRRVRSSDGSERWLRTVKVGCGVERIELEEETDARVGRALWRLTIGRRIRKRRYSVLEGDGSRWDVDAFLDRPLVLVEIELPSPDAHPELPAWLRRVLDHEVTDEPEYTNARLAK
ncbi:MAG: CHAD domain-containing protein [Gemmatimonadaceae bacterium]|nr:CHAD domain-containing protein [Gemmatimonadaceae bacterium]